MKQTSELESTLKILRPRYEEALLYALKGDREEEIKILGGCLSILQHMIEQHIPTLPEPKRSLLLLEAMTIAAILQEKDFIIRTGESLFQGSPSREVAEEARSILKEFEG